MLRRKGQDEGDDAQAGSAGGATTDRVTGLPNRDQLVPLLDACVSRGRATSERSGLLFIDIGHLRDVNDTYGPDLGDRLLLEIAQRLGAELGEGQSLVRWSGAEFALVVPGLATTGSAEALATGVFELLSEPFQIGTNTIVVSSSVGSALSDAGYRSTDAWVEDAHDAMCEARELGNRAIVARDESTRNRIDIRVTEERIHHAVQNHEFRLLYQPVVTIAERRIVGFEALLRWLDPSAGAKLVPPSVFLPLLERTGRIIEVGEWVLNEATQQVQNWNNAIATGEPWFVGVNLGARQMAQTSFSASVAKALDASGMRPELLTLDITPDALKYNKQATWSQLRDLKYLGVRLALDDFGIGESTMGYLRDIKVDLLRIHSSFVEGLGSVPEDDAIVKHLIGMGLDLGILSLAEAVETEQQAARLAELRCGLGQGFLFGRPDLPEVIEQQLA